MRRSGLILLLLLFCNPVFAQDDDPGILILHSYHTDFPWTSGIDSAVTAELRKHYPHISIQKEYFDSKRYDAEKLESLFFYYLKNKYRGMDFDVILSTDDNALRFILKYRQELFPDTPCIFCGINYIDLYDLSGEHDITGISEDFDIPANLELIKNLPLDIRNIAVVTDSTTTGRSDLIRFRDESPPYKDDFNFIYLSDLTIGELGEQLQNLPERSAVLNLCFWRDRNNDAFEPEEIMPIISEASGVPVFGARDYFITGGTFGGIVSSSDIQGRLLAQTAIQVLEGTPADRIPIHREQTTKPVFDYKVVKSFGVKMSDIPKHSVLLNTPDSLFYRNPVMFWFILFVIVSQTILVIFLGINIYRRKQSELLFKSLFNHIPDMVIVHSKKGKILQENLCAAADRDFIGRELIELSETWETVFPKAISSDNYSDAVKKEISYYVPLKNNPEKTLRHFELNSVLIRYQGKPEILSIFRDITSRKNFESELRESLEEKNILIQEVHHRVKNNLQIISSLLDLQSSNISDEAALTALLDSKRRIMTMAQAHEKLYQSDTLSKINLNVYVPSLAELFINQGPEDLIVNMECNDLNVSIDLAVTLGLILNELFSNSIKYAFTDSGPREITISCTVPNHDKLEFIYTDSGPGFDFNNKKKSSLGLKLVDALITQLKANFSYDGRRGSRFVFNIPLR